MTWGSHCFAIRGQSQHVMLDNFLRDILSLDGNSKIVVFLFHTNLSTIAYESHKLVLPFLQNFEKTCIIREKKYISTLKYVNNMFALKKKIVFFRIFRSGIIDTMYFKSNVNI